MELVHLGGKDFIKYEPTCKSITRDQNKFIINYQRPTTHAELKNR